LNRSDDPPKKMPAIYLWNVEFTSSDLSIGANAPESGKMLEEEFDGDGKRTDFKLTVPPLRPLLNIAYPRTRQRREGRDFKVDYSTGSIAFIEPPEKGRKNIFVQYHSGKDAAEVRGMRLLLTYNLDVWSDESEENSSLTNQVASILLKTRDSLASKGIALRLSGGRDLTSKDGIPSGVFCKRLQCLAEADMLVKMPIPRMEKIEMTKKKDLT